MTAMALKYFLAILLIQLNMCVSIRQLRRRHAFTVPTFEVNLIVDEELTEINTPSQHLAVSTKLKSATISYLYDYIDSILEDFARVEEDSSSNGILEGVDLEVTLYANDETDISMHTYDHASLLTAEFAGTVTFTRTSVSPSLVLNQDKVENMIYTAFLGSYALNDYLFRMQSIINGVVSVTVKSNMQRESSTGATVVYHEGSNIGTVMLSLVITSTVLLLFAIAYRDHQTRKHGKRSRSGHLLMDTDQYSDYFDDDDNASFIGGLTSGNSSTSSSSSSYEIEPIQFIPIPARIDEVTGGRKAMKPKKQEVTPRRYVSPASPFELLYGAAFSHSEKSKVQSAHGMKPKKRKSRRHLPKTTNARQLRPLNTITEEENDDKNESFFPQFMSTISSYLSEKIEHSTTTPNSQEELVDSTTTPCNSKDEYVVFRDFPRHDGTPCIMFAPFNEEQENKDNTSSLQSEVEAQDGYVNDDNQNLESDLCNDLNLDIHDDSSKIEHVDTFVDKLENLMASRARQYEERKSLHIEMTKRKKVNEEERQRERNKMNDANNSQEEDMNCKDEGNTNDLNFSEADQKSMVNELLNVTCNHQLQDMSTSETISTESNEPNDLSTTTAVVKDIDEHQVTIEVGDSVETNKAMDSCGNSLSDDDGDSFVHSTIVSLFCSDDKPGEFNTETQVREETPESKIAVDSSSPREVDKICFEDEIDS
jgi:hypothetical protein